MTNIIEQAQEVARRQEEQCRMADAAAFQALLEKEMWDDDNWELIANIWQRAERDPQLSAQIEAIQLQWLDREEERSKQRIRQYLEEREA